MNLHTLLTMAPKDAVLRFLDRYGGKRVRIPTMKAFLRSERDKSIRIHRREGMDYAALRARFNLSERQIRRILEDDQAA